MTNKTQDAIYDVKELGTAKTLLPINTDKNAIKTNKFLIFIF